MSVCPDCQPIDEKPLSFRRAQVLLCCAYGYTMQETATKLNMSYKTVDNNCTFMRKLFKLKGSRALFLFGLSIQADLEKWIGTGLKPRANAENRGELLIR